MAVLSKIRQRSLLLILVIGFCLLAFIIGDLFNHGGFNQTSKYVGTINGKDIAYEDFRVKVSNVEKSGQGMTSTQAVNRVWEQEVAIALLTAEFDKLGIRVGENHIMETFKNDPNIGQNPMFKNAAGAFDPAKFKEFFRTNPAQAQALKEREKDAALNATYMIYNSMVKGGIFTTDMEGKLKYHLESDKVSFNYVAAPYSSVKDSEVKISDDEITAYMKKNEKKYKSDETRELQYVILEDKASPEDEAEIKNKITSLLSGRVVYDKATGKNDTLPGFRDTKDIADFVNENSDVPFDSSYVAKKDLPAEHADALFNLAEGQVYGPYMRGNYLCISKLIGRKAGASAKASHILISYEGTQVPNKREKRTKEQAKAKAESLLAQALANPQSFMMLALTNSDDSSAQQGGDLGYFSPGQMVKPFNDFVFNNPVGKIGMVETDFGFHIINITDKQDAIKLATVAQKVEASEATSDKAYTKAVKLEMDANDQDFDKVAKAANLKVSDPVKVKAMDETVGAAGNQRQIVRWAFEKDTKVGDVKRFEIANVGNVIVKLKQIDEEGLMAISDARTMIEPILKNKKKAEILKAKMKGGSLDAIAKAAGVAVQQAADLTVENAVLPNLGAEPKVVGTAIALGTGKLSSPIDGNSGVYVVQATALTKAPVIKDHAQYVNKIKAMKSSDSNRVIPALKANADIEDNRTKFNY
ncbi:MAG: peptidylprolyl isomerase [Flavobacterium sp.]|nr:MAG: peptidylprolyl isomerase [Flavobacterium sp.]